MQSSFVTIRHWIVTFSTAALLGCSGGDGGSNASGDSNSVGNNTIKPGITRIEITSVESPTFQGRTFGDVGAYEKLRGKAYGELDPKDPRNTVITDLQFAPRNARGNVEYSMDIYILKPIDLAKGNHKLFMEVNNRGAKLFGALNQSTGGNNPTTSADAGQAFLMNQGYTLAWNGWDPSAPAGGDSLTISLPVARNPDGSSITGPSYEYLVFDNTTTQSAPLSYDAATRDKARAKLTVRDRLNDVAVTVPDTGWEYASDRSIRLLPAGTAFKQSAIYEFTYTAKDPVVAGIGFAATRDFVSFLRNAKTDSTNKANPLAGDIRRVHAFTISQPGRYMNDFIWLGFNQDERGGRVFDGVENWIAAGTGVALNYRFAQSPRTERNRQNHLYPEAPFPFAFNTLTDTLTGRTDGRNARCTQTDTCPKIMNVNSANEYWVKAGSLLHTDTQGNDLADPANVRSYLISGTEHTGTGSPANSPGMCAQPRNTTDPSPALRALFVALDRWVDGVAPPPSAVPRRSDGSAAMIRATAESVNGVGEVPQSELGWPSIPGVTYTGLATIRNLLDFGPRFNQGIIDNYPPLVTGRTYPAFVSKVDPDGNEVAGIRLPPVAAPVATTTGWALRATAFGGPDGCEQFGQIIPFRTTQAERVAAGDPRLSLEERYRDHAGYVQAVTQSVNRLVEQRLLLPADAQRYISAAEASSVLK
ncbi:MAG TPA: alpha/beta hydrolase domain-containing protein [Noviherbaspirillum sp.]|uniref:alpha/beta hydrolase domain-containing protein n=1 Tax=Noviherbaspirillum sp. TaxID=1926288 RepID=UPI002DDD29FB|nr:alpha/beta hydrolase domain-containing protein [Noviherbaspirillum sp.]HEV2612088.1 alpha/beta hydrolase domain-containing protein [Noviherbaspirillum sp.]